VTILLLLLASLVFFAAWPHAMHEAGLSSSTAVLTIPLLR
jgi:hypothetical protein